MLIIKRQINEATIYAWWILCSKSEFNGKVDFLSKLLMISLDMFIDSDYQRWILCANFIANTVQYNLWKRSYE